MVLINVTFRDKKGLGVLGDKWIFKNNSQGWEHDKRSHAYKADR